MSRNGKSMAYPLPVAVAMGEAPVTSAMFEESEGLTKREWFAGMALQGIMSEGTWYLPKEVAPKAVALADALLAELEKPEGDGA